jgi:hypothetical protein
MELSCPFRKLARLTGEPGKLGTPGAVRDHQGGGLASALIDSTGMPAI